MAIAPEKLILREYEEQPLKSREVRVKSRLSAEKHGTMLPLFRGIQPASFPIQMGNMTVGLVTEVGENVSRFKAGDRVYGYLPIRETHTVPEERLWPAPPSVSDEELVCVDPAAVALMAVREGGVKLGENVAVFGLGAIGLMAVQLARLSGALTVLGIDLLKRRRRLAEKYGADAVIDPKERDAASECRERTGGKGVDIVLETTGSYGALNQAIKGTRYGGTIVTVSWYHGEARGLRLGEEWHFNRQVMVSGARVESEPYRDYPRWDRQRVYATVLELFKRRALSVEGMLSPIVSFDEVVEAYRIICEKPEESVKLGIRYET
ncbi:MAG: zinc-binding alcohol dehydrogenase [Candidatus Bathyarchaeia archaeon]